MQPTGSAKSTGANVTFKIKDTDKDFTVSQLVQYTLFGADLRSLVEHDLVDSITSLEQAEAVAEQQMLSFS